MRTIALCLAGVLVLPVTTVRANAQSFNFTTLAGSAPIGSADGIGAQAHFSSPGGVAVDASGNILLADSGNDTIRMITPSGLVTTLAGQAGLQGSADGTGTNALFNRPRSLAVDTNGNILVADTSNHTIRKITPAGVVTTLAGQALVPGSTNATGTNAQFYLPEGIAIDANGNLYVADTGNNTIRKVSAVGTNWVVSTVAGVARIQIPSSPRVGESGNGVESPDK